VLTLRNGQAGAKFGTDGFATRDIRLWFGAWRRATIRSQSEAEEASMQEIFARAYVAGSLASRRLSQAHGQQGQGTVEYVGLILLVALLMVGMVAAMKGFQGKQGLELAETIVDKIRSAVNQVTFK
jgi:hypothetical protein